MKKVFAILAVASMAAFVACGNGDDAKKKAEDSARQADSLAKIEAENQRKADSARVADSLANLPMDTAAMDTTAKQ